MYQSHNNTPGAFHYILEIFYINKSELKLIHRPLDHTREVLMGVGDGFASAIMLTFTKRPGSMLTFTKRPGPHADTAWAVVG